jgi:hypothetical protein
MPLLARVNARWGEVVPFSIKVIQMKICSEMIKQPSPTRGSLRSMSDDSQGQDDRWNWLMIGVILVLVVVALYGPLVWEITRGG